MSLLGSAIGAERSMLARVTVYWASGGSGADSWTRKHMTASGSRLRAGHCAVDPRCIPYGSRVRLPDGTLHAVDTGSAVRSRRAARRGGRSAAERNAIVIDRFFESKAQALAWERRNPPFMTVQVATPDERVMTTPPPRAIGPSRSTVIRTTSVTTTTQQPASSLRPLIRRQPLPSTSTVASSRQSSPAQIAAVVPAPSPSVTYTASAPNNSPKIAANTGTRPRFAGAVLNVP